MESKFFIVLMTVITFAAIQRLAICRFNFSSLTIESHINRSYINSSSELVNAVLDRYYMLLTSTHTPPKVYITDADVLRDLLTALANRFKIVPDLARYKWKNGIQTLPSKERLSQIMKTIKDQAIKYKLVQEEAEHFMTDVLEGDNFIEFTLLSDWYANFPESDDIFPQADNLNVTQLKDNLDKSQDKIIRIMSSLTSFRGNRDCFKILSENIFNDQYFKSKIKSKVLYRVATSVAMAKFCKSFTKHDDSAQEVTTVKTKFELTRKQAKEVKYWEHDN